MNKNLFKLLVDSGVMHAMKHTNIDIDNEVEKFAELIIKDCYSVIIKSQRGHFNPATSWDAVVEHFGVEE